MRIAVVGAGISGLTCAAALSRRHMITLYARERYLGDVQLLLEKPGRRTAPLVHRFEATGR